MNWREKYQSSFNHYPIKQPELVFRPESYAKLQSTQTIVIPRGLGKSYGDAALNQQGEIILTERLDRFLKFDEQQGNIVVESGISLAKILEVIVACGWFLPVTPGTADVSIGGCVATDVHGKNHYTSGSLGHYVTDLELITAKGDRVRCSPTVHEKLFWATIGGMGLTGIIGTVSLRLKRIETAYMSVQYKATQNLEQTFTVLTQNNAENEYSVAWLDGLNTPLGRGVIMKANHANLMQLSALQRKQPLMVTTGKSYKIPFYLPHTLLCPTLVKSFNKAYYFYLRKKEQLFLSSFNDYFYPLDRIRNWPRLYGKQGFIQYQCALPTKFAYSVIERLLSTLANYKCPIYLAVLKRFGNANLAPLSFPLNGFTLAVDIPISNEKLFTCLNKLDEMVIDAGGRVYLAKDARLTPEAFRAMYPRFPEWLAVKQQWDPQNRFSSNLARRLNISIALQDAKAF